MVNFAECCFGKWGKIQKSVSLKRRVTWQTPMPQRPYFASALPCWKSIARSILFLHLEFNGLDEQLVAHLNGNVVSPRLNLRHFQGDFVIALVQDGSFEIILVIGKVNCGNRKPFPCRFRIRSPYHSLCPKLDRLQSPEVYFARWSSMQGKPPRQATSIASACSCLSEFISISLGGKRRSYAVPWRASEKSGHFSPHTRMLGTGIQNCPCAGPYTLRQSMSM